MLTRNHRELFILTIVEYPISRIEQYREVVVIQLIQVQNVDIVQFHVQSSPLLPDRQLVIMRIEVMVL